MRYFTKDALGNPVTYKNWQMKDYKAMIIWLASGLPAWILLYYSLDVLPVGLAETI